MPFLTHPTPIGPLTMTAESDRLVQLSFESVHPAEPSGPTEPILAHAAAQLDEYFAGRRRRFELPLELGGTDFSRLVWAALTEIPYAQTTTYGALADRLEETLGRAVGARAVASAVARTPVPIIVPCHRVIGADGALRGYIGGLERKRALLDLELTAAGATRLTAPAAA